ncbi:MAG TPA: type III pantothenate kinase [Gammaproteobacteria bacterium]
MIAVLDIGNARLKWALVSGGSLLNPGSAPHLGDSRHAVQSFIDAFPEGVGRVVATNVAGPTVAESVETAVASNWNAKVEWVITSGTQLGVTCAYAEPLRMGADRWVAILAAHSMAPGSVCVIDAGTAVTFDAVDAGGLHLGGLIMAGPPLAAASLSQRTSEIGVTVSTPGRASGLEILGRSTNDAVANGVMLALSSGLCKAVEIVTEGLGTIPTVVLCGGDAASLLPWLDSRVQYREHLVLEGLALIATEL